MDPHTWPRKSRTTSTNVHSAAMWELYDIPHIFYTWIIHTHCLRTLTGYYWYIYIYIYISHRQTVSLHHNSSVWVDMREAPGWNRNPSDFTSVGYLTPKLSSSQRKRREFLGIYSHIRLSAIYKDYLALNNPQRLIWH